MNRGSLLFGLTLNGAIQLMASITSMVADGLFDRIPELKVLCVESGAGWAPYLMDRLDQKYSYAGWRSPLELRPSEYLQRNVWFVAEPEERTIASQLELVGRDHILWGSDFPHVDSTLEAPALINQSVSGLSPEDRIRVLGGNAVQLFGLS
jgi:predicted TIM-barrel fold metal-dependent hydrolase